MQVVIADNQTVFVDGVQLLPEDAAARIETRSESTVRLQVDTSKYNWEWVDTDRGELIERVRALTPSAETVERVTANRAKREVERQVERQVERVERQAKIEAESLAKRMPARATDKQVAYLAALCRRDPGLASTFGFGEGVDTSRWSKTDASRAISLFLDSE